LREIILKSGKKLRGKDEGCAKNSFYQRKIGKIVGREAEGKE
jgi:hypothetical protein